MWVLSRGMVELYGSRPLLWVVIVLRACTTIATGRSISQPRDVLRLFAFQGFQFSRQNQAVLAEVNPSVCASLQANAMNNLSPSMFPDDSDAAKFALERCMRVLPHHGDTGGFFIAVLEKTGDMPLPQPDR